jgi:hypothetical protein
MAKYTQGYVSSTPESATAPKRDSGDPYNAPGAMSVAYKAKWRNKREPFPYGQDEEGGGGGGDA